MAHLLGFKAPLANFVVDLYNSLDSLDTDNLAHQAVVANSALWGALAYRKYRRGY